LKRAFETKKIWSLWSRSRQALWLSPDVQNANLPRIIASTNRFGASIDKFAGFCTTGIDFNAI
jgi:hypothetical protein